MNVILRSLIPALLILPAAAGAADEHPGKALYERYCASCHGETAKGDGPLAGILRQQPSNLTLLAKNAGGRFPFWETMRVIDGSRSVRAHGGSDMPVWGEVFRDEADWELARRAEVHGKLTFLTEYLLRIQEK
ncbi:MAG: c-type cytochrome [Candidatus Binatia bacterium]